MGDFLIRELVEFTQNQDLTIKCRNAIQRFPYRFPYFPPAHLVLSRTMLRRRLAEFVEFVDMHQTFLPFQEIKRQVPGDAVDPGLEVVRWAQPIEVQVRTDEGVLGDVLSRPSVSKHAIDIVQHRLMMALEELGEGLLVTRLRSSNQVDAIPSRVPLGHM